MAFHIVLLEPEIPANTGNIGRSCVCTGSKLHLIRPLGFEVSDKMLKRAGLDYWKDLDVQIYDSFEDFLSRNPDCRGRLYMATTKAERTYADVRFRDGDYIMFGKESAGIPEEILVQYEPWCIRIPMAQDCRSLNLSNSASIVLYEALRQNDFLQLEQKGALHRLAWHNGD